MIIDVNKLKYSGKLISQFAFCGEAQSDLLVPFDYVIDGGINVNGTVELHSSDVYVDCEVNCTIVGRCARCLEKSKYLFSEEFSAKYVLNNAEEGDFLYKRGVVDLTEAVNECIITNAPSVIYCKQDCKGLCPKCGCNLNETDCDCK